MKAANDNQRPRAKLGEARAFLDDVIARKDEIRGCVFWPYSRNMQGYAQITLNGKPGLAHRAVCKAVNGPPPLDRPQAAHNCGNGKLGCVSPDCLRWANQVENESDKILHGTKMVGDDAPWSKVTTEIAREIHVMRSSGATQEDIASGLRIRRQQVSRIASGERWGHIHPDNDPITAEMVSRVQSPKFTQDCRVTMCNDDVRMIHVFRAHGLSLSKISAEVGSNPKQVSRIINRERRTNLHPDNDNVTAKMVAEAKRAV